MSLNFGPFAVDCDVCGAMAFNPCTGECAHGDCDSVICKLTREATERGEMYCAGGARERAAGRPPERQQDVHVFAWATRDERGTEEAAAAERRAKARAEQAADNQRRLLLELGADADRSVILAYVNLMGIVACGWQLCIEHGPAGFHGSLKSDSGSRIVRADAPTVGELARELVHRWMGGTSPLQRTTRHGNKE